MNEWIKVSDRLPERGQRIMGRSDAGQWVEDFDPDEPLGFMSEWRPYGWMEQERDVFETACYGHYLDQKRKGRVNPAAEGDGTPEALFWRKENGQYGVEAFNAAWWGWLAGQDRSQPEVSELDGAAAEDAWAKATQPGDL